MTIAELKAKLPPPLQGWADQYGPIFLAWGAADFQAWLAHLIKGDLYGAYAKVLAGMNSQEAVEEWATIHAAWTAANADNAARASIGRQALAALLQVLLSISLAAVGL